MRQFGLSRREAVGGNQLPGSRISADTTRANSNSVARPHPPGELGSNSARRLTAASPLFIKTPAGSILESGEISKPSFDEREAVTCIFLIAFLSAIAGLSIFIYCGLQSFIP
jgi:hypothetical protein